MVAVPDSTTQKQGYKLTEVGWIPEEWEVKPLGDLGEFKNGINKGSTDFGYGFPFVNLLDVFDVPQIFSKFELGLINSTELERKIYKLSKGDVLFVRSSVKPEGVGLTTLVADNLMDTVYSGFLIRFKDKGKLDTNFKIYCFKESGFRNRLIASSTVSANTNINQVALKTLLIAYPPSLKEQQAIATALSDVDALISSLEGLIAKKRAIKQATMQQLLTGKVRLEGFSGEWETRSFGELFQFLSTANNSRSDLSENEEIKYIHYGDIHTKWRTFVDCAKDVLPSISRNKVGNIPFLEDGDLVMADASEDYEGIGISVEVKNATGKKVIAGLHTFLLRGNKELLVDGFKGYLQYIPVIKDALRKAATGISVYGISKNSVRNITVRLPDITEQRAIARILSDMDEEIVGLERRREKTRLLKQSMMQELLTGKTRLR
jgi:type I restriction enzyme, S subunit